MYRNRRLFRIPVVRKVLHWKGIKEVIVYKESSILLSLKLFIECSVSGSSENYKANELRPSIVNDFQFLTWFMADWECKTIINLAVVQHDTAKTDNPGDGGYGIYFQLVSGRL